MSLYNTVMRHNPLAGTWMEMLDLTPELLERPRDAWLQDDGDHGLRIVVLTRCGGGNRDAHAEMYSRLEKHPGYLGDRDADFDTTYAFHDFKIPEDRQEDVDLILEAARAENAYDRIVDNRTLKKRFDEAMEAMEGTFKS